MRTLILWLIVFLFLPCFYLSAFSESLIKADTLPDGRYIYELSTEELKLFSNPFTRSLVTGSDQDIYLSIGERFYLFGSMLTITLPSAKLVNITKVLPGFSKLETAITQSAEKIWRSQTFKNGIAGMREGRSSEAIIHGTKVVFQADGPFSGFTLFGENGFVIGKEALKSSDETIKTVLHECYRLSTSTAQLNKGISQNLLTQETENVVNFVERAFKTIRHE